MELSDEDLRGLERLVARYNQAWDAGDALTWASTFTADATFTGLHGTYRGRAELEAYCRGATANRPGGFAPRARQHWTTNALFEGDGRTATGRCYLMMVVRHPDGSGAIDRVGWYDDECRKADGAWRFTRRTVTEAASWPDLG